MKSFQLILALIISMISFTEIANAQLAPDDPSMDLGFDLSKEYAEAKRLHTKESD